MKYWEERLNELKSQWMNSYDSEFLDKIIEQEKEMFINIRENWLRDDDLKNAFNDIFNLNESWEEKIKYEIDHISDIGGTIQDYMNEIINIIKREIKSFSDEINKWLTKDSLGMTLSQLLSDILKKRGIE